MFRRILSLKRVLERRADAYGAWQEKRIAELGQTADAEVFFGETSLTQDDIVLLKPCGIKTEQADVARILMRGQNASVG